MTYEPEYEDADEAGNDEIERICREALMRLEDGDANAARETAVEAVALDDSHPFPLFVLGVIADQEGDRAAARYLADQALQLAHTNADAIQFRAQLHIEDHEFEAAERLLKFGIVHNPDDSGLHEHLARVLLAEGHAAEAAHAAHASIRIDPGNGGAHAVRMAALDVSGDAQSMLAVLRQAVQLNPDDPYTMVELAGVEAENGNLDRARSLLARAQRLAPRDHQIAEVRQMIDGAHAHPALRALPPLMRWLRDFPGGLAGFLVAFVIAAMPLHALTADYPAYALPAWTVLVSWGVIGLYCWVGPAVLAIRLTQGAAVAAERRVRNDIDAVNSAAGAGTYSPDATAGKAVYLDLERLDDALALHVAGRSYRAGVRLLRDATTAVAPQQRQALRSLDRLQRRFINRLFYRLAVFPGDVRLLVAAGALTGLAAPVLAGAADARPLWFQLAALGLWTIAWTIARRELHLQKLVHTMVEAARASTPPIEYDKPTRRQQRNDEPPLREAG